MLDLSLTTNVVFPALVGFFASEIVKPGPDGPVELRRRREHGERRDRTDRKREQNCGCSLSQCPSSWSVARRG